MQNKYLAMTPPMGWNSWNTFTWNINEDLVCGAADALCASGLKIKAMSTSSSTIAGASSSATKTAALCRIRRSSRTA